MVKQLVGKYWILLESPREQGPRLTTLVLKGI